MTEYRDFESDGRDLKFNVLYGSTKEENQIDYDKAPGFQQTVLAN